MRFANLATCAVAAAVISGFALNYAAEAQPDTSGDEKPLPHATPLPPPDSLKPGAPMDADDGGQKLPQDQPVTMNGVTVLCTGTGSSKDNPEWQSYPVRVEFSSAAAQFLKIERARPKQCSHIRHVAQTEIKVTIHALQG